MNTVFVDAIKYSSVLNLVVKLASTKGNELKNYIINNTSYNNYLLLLLVNHINIKCAIVKTKTNILPY